MGGSLEGGHVVKHIDGYRVCCGLGTRVLRMSEVIGERGFALV